MKRKLKNNIEVSEDEMSNKDFFDNESKKLKLYKKHQKKEQAKIIKTPSNKKMWNYILDLTKRPAFKKDLKEFRQKFSIPENGYNKLIYTKDFSGRKVLTYPNYKEIQQKENYTRNRISLARKYQLNLSSRALESYIFYNKFLVDKETMGSMIEIEDIYSQVTGNFGLSKSKQWYVLDNLEERAFQFPVAIFLNPYVSQRDIIDYVKKTFKLSIEPKLKWYRDSESKLGKVRKKSTRVEQRNDFIFNNRHKPMKEIISLVSKEFKEILDYTYISTIIKKEEGVRK